MSTNKPLPAKHFLEPITRVLKQYGGYFTFSDEEGNEFVVTSGDEFRSGTATETQLPLPAVPNELASQKAQAEEALEKINREIALHQLQLSEENFDELTPAPADDLRPPLRVRFEPLTGDLPPELQE